MDMGLWEDLFAFWLTQSCQQYYDEIFLLFKHQMSNKYSWILMIARAIFKCCQIMFNGDSTSNSLHSFWKLTDVIDCGSCYHSKFFAFPLDLSAWKTEREQDMLHHSTDPVKKHFISQKTSRLKQTVIYSCRIRMSTNITQSKPWYVVIKWKTAFKRSIGEFEIQNKWRRNLHLIQDYFDNGNLDETVQLSKSTFETFTRSEGCKAKLSITVNILDLKSDPTRKPQP